MDNVKIKELKQVLKRVNSGEDIQKVKEETRDFLASIEPYDLAMAEQELMKSGVKHSDLKQLCSLHLEVLDDPSRKKKTALKPGHVIHTLMSEHELISDFLDKLEGVNALIQKMEKFENDKEEWDKLNHISEHLLEAEKHHQREEKVLFEEIEKRGVFGPPEMMRMDHEELRKRKKIIDELAKEAQNADFLNAKDFGGLKSELNEAADFLVKNLREHIFKEDNILYPIALDVVSDEKDWQAMKERCDKIGYCCFTPKF